MHVSTLLRALAFVTVIPRIATLPQGLENELDTADTTEWNEEEPTSLEDLAEDAVFTETSYDDEAGSAWPNSTDEEDTAPATAVGSAVAAEPTVTPREWEEQEQDKESVSEDDTALEYGAMPEEVDFEDASFNETSVSEAEDPFIALTEWPEPW